MNETTKTMAAGLIAAVLTNLPFYAWVFNENWAWAMGFPLAWLAAGLGCMVTFFHELGHTITAWFYGFAALPSFDFQHGGGLTYWFGDQSLILVAIIDLAVAYGIYYFRDIRFLQGCLAVLLVFNLATTFSEDIYMSVIDFMGPASEGLIAGFFLFRAIFNLAPRGTAERFLNAAFGFGIIFHALIDGYGLLSSAAHRLMYFEQKGMHGFGDFDKISDRFYSLNFEGIVWVWLILCFLCLIIPFIMPVFFTSKRLENHNI